jgi:thiol-disulfide isomerase/thioredoxin
MTKGIYSASIVKRTKIIEVEFYADDCVPCDAQ